MEHTRCRLMWDGETLTVPEELGKPKDGQLAGSPLDNLVELAGRVCYDSLGKGRSSEEYHRHIVEVGHLSVQEHTVLTFDVRHQMAAAYGCDPHIQPIDKHAFFCLAVGLLNRPGVWARWWQEKPGWYGLRLTTNLRAIREWRRWTTDSWGLDLGERLELLAAEQMPLASCRITQELSGEDRMFVTVVPPETDEEVWASLFLTNISRGCSHEIVRHGDFTGISQRSTRYVDEDDSPWIWHPLFQRYWDSAKDPLADAMLKEAAAACRTAYKDAVGTLQGFLAEQGADKHTARKQARGAARGVLGNALMTEMVFSASIAQWKRMMLLRAHPGADGEIRLMFDEAFEILSARFPDRFRHWVKKPCPDGIGYALEYSPPPGYALEYSPPPDDGNFPP